MIDARFSFDSLSGPDWPAAVCWVAALITIGVAGYGMFSGLKLIPLTPPATAQAAIKPVAMALHMLSGGMALAVASFQLLLIKIQSSVRWHRVLGWIYGAAVLMSGFAAFALFGSSIGGLNADLGFSLLSAAWLLATVRAIQHARNQNWDAHQWWMIRSFSLCFAAVTLRIYLGAFFALGVPFEQFYTALAWLCWVPNLVVVEWFLLKR
jgi:uncharacterized membrane protein